MSMAARGRSRGFTTSARTGAPVLGVALVAALLAAAEPERITRLDASESREAVHHRVMSRVKPAVDALS